ncbi:MAG: hypothetical protein J0M18_06945 [Ignavibacteria bacterium]|nr:hypothetical protein [Ignavibacteria bacterium]
MKKIIALKNFFQLFFLITLIAFNGCTNNDLVNSNIGGYEYSLNVVNYSDQHFFLDTAYKSNFKDFSVDGTLDNPENIARQVSNENFEVWIQTGNTTADRKFGSLIIDLPPLPLSGYYDTSFYQPRQIQGKRYFGLFRKLSSTEFLINYQAGYISLKTNLYENDYIGVSYKEIGTGKTYGTNSIAFTQDTLVLKMMKAGNVDPSIDTLAWAMKMRNIYRLPVSGIVQTGFEFKTYYISPLTLLPSAYLPGDGPLIEALGLGQYIPPDITIFNYIPGRTVIPETGDIIFPTLEPFNTSVANASGGDTSLAFKDLYTKLKSEAHISPKANLYWLKGKVISPGSIAQ